MTNNKKQKEMVEMIKCCKEEVDDVEVTTDASFAYL